ncbi:MAG: PepSY domain-containing protein [Chloroflexota bacterium]
MNIKILAGSGAALGLLGLGILAGSLVGAGGVSAQATAALSSTGANAQVAQISQYAVSYSDIAGAPAAQAAATAVPSQPAPAQPAPKSSTSIQAAITRAQAEQTALAASPGSTIDHSSLQDQNGTAVYDVDFTNGGGVVVDANTGAVIATEAAGADKGGNRGPGGGRGGHGGGADQAALAAKATVTQQQAEQTALTTSPGNTVDHSRLGQDASGTIFWDVDFANGGGVVVNAQTGAVITTEAAGTDRGGRPQAPAATQP